MSITSYLARHCDVENPRQVMYGHLPGFGLSARGRAQAEALGAYFRDRDIALIRTSPLERAVETATIIARHLDRVEVETDEDLVEAEFGKYLQGVPYRQVPLRRPRWFIHFAFPGLLAGDEGVPRMARRVRAAIDRARRDSGGRPVICVSHADPVQSFWVDHLGRDPRQMHRQIVPKGAFLELEYEGDTLREVTRHGPLSQPEPEALPS